MTDVAIALPGDLRRRTDAVTAAICGVLAWREPLTRLIALSRAENVVLCAVAQAMREYTTDQLEAPMEHQHTTCAPLDKSTEALLEGMRAAMAAIYHLSDAGCTALRVEAGGGMPRITIEPPRNCPLLTDHASVRTAPAPLGGVRLRVKVAKAWGCAIEWQAPEHEVRHG